MAFEKDVDRLWDSFLADCLVKTTEQLKALYTSKGINEVFDKLNITGWREEIYSNFAWEFIHVKGKPHRNLEWVNGDHVSLFDTFYCKDCGTFITTRDDTDECFAPLLCPTCNNLEKYHWQAITKNNKDYAKVYDYEMAMKRFNYIYNHKVWGPLYRFKCTVARTPHRIWFTLRMKLSTKYREAFDAELKRKLRINLD